MTLEAATRDYLCLMVTVESIATTWWLHRGASLRTIRPYQYCKAGSASGDCLGFARPLALRWSWEQCLAAVRRAAKKQYARLEET